MSRFKLPTLCSEHFADGCMRNAWARGFCRLHYGRAYSGRPLHGPTRRLRGVFTVCTVDGCERPPSTYGLCRLHRERELAHGTPTLADDLAEQQGGVCAICQRQPSGRGHEARLHLDHDHETGRIRGMLCGPCNKALGLLGDDPELLIAALAYLEAPGLHGYVPGKEVAR